jgi:hypothetical protein
VPIAAGKGVEAERDATSFVSANFDRLNQMFPE